MREAAAKARTIYEAVMGDAIGRLAKPVASFHRAVLPMTFAGRASVERGTNGLAMLIGAIMGLPRASLDCEVRITVSGDARNEVWERRFDGRPFVSRQHPGGGRWQGVMVEQIGPMSFAYALEARGEELHLDLRGWRAFGIPMPLALGARVKAFEHGADGRFNFDVEIGLPVVGRLVRYRGWLTPAA